MEKIGKYVLVGPPMVGGYGRVFKAMIPGEPGYYAIKVPKRAGNAAHVKALKDEARALGRIEHPNVIQLVDVQLEGDLPYIVMNFLEKGSLSGYLNPKLEPELVALLLMQVGSGLKAYHESGGFHRDIKPDNILLGMEGDWQFVLADASLAKVPEDGEPSTRGVIGTPGYIDPWVQAGFYDALADIYSLGVTAAVALTGMSPEQIAPNGLLQFQTLLGKLPQKRVSEPLAKLVRAMTRKERNLRPNAKLVCDFCRALLEDQPLPALPTLKAKPKQLLPVPRVETGNDLAGVLVAGGIVALIIVGIAALLGDD